MYAGCGANGGGLMRLKRDSVFEDWFGWNGPAVEYQTRRWGDSKRSKNEEGIRVRNISKSDRSRTKNTVPRTKLTSTNSTPNRNQHPHHNLRTSPRRLILHIWDKSGICRTTTTTTLGGCGSERGCIGFDRRAGCVGARQQCANSIYNVPEIAGIWNMDNVVY